MITNIGSLKVHFLGDPHLGKKFQNGVPLHRRGEREASQFRDLEASLRSAGDCDMHINVGDIFDRFHVPYNVVYDTADLYVRWALSHPKTSFVVIAGNHDLSKDREKRSAFELFDMMVRRIPNIFVEDYPIAINGVGFLPYNPFVSASDCIDTLMLMEEPVFAVVGHWDVDRRSDPHNLIPTEKIAAYGVSLAFTGHDHLPRTEVRDGVTINVIGSMQPYSHAEDPNERIYVTRTLDQVRENPEIYRDKCLRVDQVPDFEIDCLQLTVQRKDRETDDISVDLGAGFDLDRLMDESLSEVNEEMRFVVKQKFMEMRGI